MEPGLVNNKPACPRSHRHCELPLHDFEMVAGCGRRSFTRLPQWQLMRTCTGMGSVPCQCYLCQVNDIVVAGFAARQLYLLLDQHRSDRYVNGQSGKTNHVCEIPSTLQALLCISLYGLLHVVRTTDELICPSDPIPRHCPPKPPKAGSWHGMIRASGICTSTAPQ